MHPQGCALQHCFAPGRCRAPAVQACWLCMDQVTATACIGRHARVQAVCAARQPEGTRPALPRHAARLAPPVAQLALPVAPYAGHLRARVVQCRQDRSGAPARVWPATTCRGGCSAASRASMRRCMHRTSARLGCQPPGLQAAAPCGCVHLPERARQHSHVGPTCGVMLA